ncbi:MULTISPECIES: serine/threonine-protein kinase [Sorangium]|uniref:Protein kinase n=1 Tax=Sorangium cellulosum TaxID=56 RepID=A0A4P2QX07_SORCE|nr:MULTISPECIES: serine/threonine-protein kinase [Sorangium]AUX34955.1 protein kinase [Sorangium cellulosum]WCQ94262.1 serine-threonine kinase [Sorangium sp. Soce836]
MPVHCGEVIADRYRVERLLGIGGMGAVVAARHLSLGELVAIKFMRAEHCGNAALLRRFQREARGMFRLKTEHVPRVYDLGALAPRAGIALPVPYIVMEHLSGNDLRSIVERRGRLPVDEAAEYVRQACVALMEAHALGMVHRDLKPANLFLTYRTDGTPLVKVLDFGVAKFTCARPEEDGLEMTTARSVMGSRRYMAPEQMLTPKDVDLRADLWALGVVLYQLVSGALPFGAETLEQLVLVVSEQAPRPLRSACAELPEGFEEIVMGCLEKNRARRPASARELAAALSPFALRGPPDATLPTAVHRSQPTYTWVDEGPPTSAVRPPTTAVRPSEAPASGVRRPRRAWLMAGAFSASAALAATVAPPGWPRSAGVAWSDGASAPHLAGVPQGLAGEPLGLAGMPQGLVAGPLGTIAVDGALHAPRTAADGVLHGGAGAACGGPETEVRAVPPDACDGASAVAPTRGVPHARADAGRPTRAAARAALVAGPWVGPAPQGRSERQEPPAASGDAPSAGRDGTSRRPGPAEVPSPAASTAAAGAAGTAAAEPAAPAPASGPGTATGAPVPMAAPGHGAEAPPSVGAQDSPW